MRIQSSFPSEEKGDEFSLEYENVRQAMEFYQDSSSCDYFFQNPSFELVDVAAFDEDQSIAANTENLVKNIDAWLNSEFKNR